MENLTLVGTIIAGISIIYNILTKLKNANLTKELLELEEQKEKAAKLIIESNQMISQNKLDLAHCYKEFFDRKNKMEFVLYDRFPSSEIFKLHITRTSDRFPMHESGVLDVKELAELIK